MHRVLGRRARPGPGRGSAYRQVRYIKCTGDNYRLVRRLGVAQQPVPQVSATTAPSLGYASKGCGGQDRECRDARSYGYNHPLPPSWRRPLIGSHNEGSVNPKNEAAAKDSDKLNGQHFSLMHRSSNK
jgi:hypothetical protein